MLNKGDKVIVLSPSGFSAPEKIKSGLEVISTWDLEVVQGAHLFSKHGYFAGTDSERKSDIQEAFNDPDVKAIICARGGYGLSRIIDSLDTELLLKYPKLLIGFSDVTLLHLLYFSSELTSIHGPMLSQWGDPVYRDSVANLKEYLFTGKQTIKLIKKSLDFPQTGVVTGGNLSMLVDSIGTKLQPKLNGKVLFIEEIGEGIYKIDRMWHHLKRSGLLKGVKGILFGHFTAIGDTKPAYHLDVKGLLKELAELEDLPYAFIEAGHEAPNYSIPFNSPFELKDSDFLQWTN